MKAATSKPDASMPTPAFVAHGRELLTRRLVDEAVVVLRTGLAEHPHPEGALLLGRALVVAGRFAEARGVLEMLVETSSDVDAFYLLGRVLLALRDGPSALSFTRQACERFPRDPSLSALKVQAEGQLGDSVAHLATGEDASAVLEAGRDWRFGDSGEQVEIFNEEGLRESTEVLDEPSRVELTDTGDDRPSSSATDTTAATSSYGPLMGSSPNLEVAVQRFSRAADPFQRSPFGGLLGEGPPLPRATVLVESQSDTTDRNGDSRLDSRPTPKWSPSTITQALSRLGDPELGSAKDDRDHSAINGLDDLASINAINDIDAISDAAEMVAADDFDDAISHGCEPSLSIASAVDDSISDAFSAVSAIDGPSLGGAAPAASGAGEAYAAEHDASPVDAAPGREKTLARLRLGAALEGVDISDQTRASLRPDAPEPAISDVDLELAREFDDLAGGSARQSSTRAARPSAMAQASAPALDAEDEEERSFKRDEQLAARDDEELEQQTPPDDDFLGSVARHRAQRQNKKPTTNLRATTRQPREGDEHEGDEATPIFQPTDELTPENEDYPPEGLRRRATRETPATHEQTGPKRPVTGPRVPDPLAGVENDEPDTELAARADELFDEPPLTDLAPRPVSSELIPLPPPKDPAALAEPIDDLLDLDQVAAKANSPEAHDTLELRKRRPTPSGRALPALPRVDSAVEVSVSSRFPQQNHESCIVIVDTPDRRPIASTPAKNIVAVLHPISQVSAARGKESAALDGRSLGKGPVGEGSVGEGSVGERDANERDANERSDRSLDDRPHGRSVEQSADRRQGSNRAKRVTGPPVLPPVSPPPRAPTQTTLPTPATANPEPAAAAARSQISTVDQRPPKRPDAARVQTKPIGSAEREFRRAATDDMIAIAPVKISRPGEPTEDGVRFGLDVQSKETVEQSPKAARPAAVPPPPPAAALAKAPVKQNGNAEAVSAPALAASLPPMAASGIAWSSIREPVADKAGFPRWASWSLVALVGVVASVVLGLWLHKHHRAGVQLERARQLAKGQQATILRAALKHARQAATLGGRKPEVLALAAHIHARLAVEFGESTLSGAASLAEESRRAGGPFHDQAAVDLVLTNAYVSLATRPLPQTIAQLRQQPRLDSNKEVSLLLAIAFYRNGEYGKARRSLDTLEQQFATTQKAAAFDARVRILSTFVAWRRGRVDQARKQLQGLTQHGLSGDQAKLLLARIDVSSGTTDSKTLETLAELERAATLSSAERSWARLLLSVMERRAGRYAVAGQALRQALDTQPSGDPEYHAVAAHELVAQNRQAAALREANRAVELAPSNPLCMVAKAQTLLAMDEPEKAAELLERVKDDSPAEPRRTLLAIRVHVRRGRLNLARAELRKLALGLGSIRALAKARIELAAGLPHSALKTLRAVQDKGLVALSLRGTAHARAGELKSAARQLRAALAIYAKHADSLWALGRLHQRLGEAAAARAALKASAEANPHRLRTRIDYGWLLLALGNHRGTARRHDRPVGEVRIARGYVARACVARACVARACVARRIVALIRREIGSAISRCIPRPILGRIAHDVVFARSPINETGIGLGWIVRAGHQHHGDQRHRETTQRRSKQSAPILQF
jgi:tetratricopeptide (TPR) repeat protein